MTMKKINCEIISFSNSAHLQQLYAGFQLLKAKNIITIKQKTTHEDIFEKNKPFHLQYSKLYHLKVILNSKLKLYYDVHDSFEIDDKILDSVDYYFKRSFYKKYIEQKKEKQKIFPLGMNYLVYSNRFDIYGLKRLAFDKKQQKFYNFFQYSCLSKLFRKKVYIPNIQNCKSLPDFNLNPKILFMTRTWNPNEFFNKKKAEEVENINLNRAKCIKLLRKEFGDLFLGGFSHDDYSQKNFKDCLLTDTNFSKKSKYMKNLSAFSICISTEGLHGSIGWKLGEYVAFSRAIVSEGIKYQLPGNFECGKNYLEFNCPDECILASLALFKDKKLRDYLMYNNYLYYNNFLKPDSMVLNTLLTSLMFSK